MPGSWKSTFLELSGLDQFVAASYGAQQKVTVVMEKSVVEFGEEERARLAQDMSPKQITVCEDETFHPRICLVSIEPVSNFILLEQYADNRQAQTWTNAMEETTAELLRSYNRPVMKARGCYATWRHTWVLTTLQTCSMCNTNWSKESAAPLRARRGKLKKQQGTGYLVTGTA